jgi:hypothetical protein
VVEVVQFRFFRSGASCLCESTKANFDFSQPEACLGSRLASAVELVLLFRVLPGKSLGLLR